MKTPRPYQEAATSAVFDYFAEKSGNPLVVAPVASGKSLLMAELAKKACALYPRTRILYLAHNKELLKQNEAELRGQWPQAETGFYCAGLGSKRTTAPITFASIQSIHKKALAFKPFDLILVDECHLIPENENTQYRKFITDMLAANPKVKIVGYTGTPYRSDSGLLIEGGVFDEVIYEIEMQFLIDEGFLCPPVTPPVKTKLDATGVATRNGDYIEKQLQAAVNTDSLNDACVREILEIGAERKCWLVFTAGIDHANAVAEILRENGVDAEAVTSNTPKHEAEAIIARYKSGKLKCLVNVAMFTTGFNNPMIDLLVFMRPTRSPVLYVQCAGRGMRTHPDKEDVMILDFGGVIDELGPIDKINVSAKAKGSGDGDSEPPTKQCPKCYAYAYAASKFCGECEYEFVSDDPDLFKSSAKGRAVLSSQEGEPEETPVFLVTYKKHEREGKTPSLRVDYNNGVRVFSEWVCFEHEGFARRKAEHWHKQRSNDIIPRNVDEALWAIEKAKQYYKEPKRITVKKEGQYWRIIKYDFEEKQEEKEDEECEICW